MRKRKGMRRGGIRERTVAGYGGTERGDHEGSWECVEPITMRNV